MSREFEKASGDVLAAAVEVHRVLGPGYQEIIYENALCVELGLRGIAFKRQHEIVIDYKGTDVGRHRIDLIVADEILVELKAVSELTGDHVAQILAYLKSSGIRVGLLLNFAKAALQTKRVVS